MNQDINTALALVSIGSFAVQQSLQIFDLPITCIVRSINTCACLKALAESDVKKSVMSLLSFVLGTLLSGLAGIRVLVLLRGTEVNWLLDTLISGLVLGAGTEGSNSFLKYVGYVKDARAAAIVGDVSIIPQTATIPVNGSYRFVSRVANADDPGVDWAVVQQNSGAIDTSGLYTAPGVAGTYQVMATSRVDRSKVGIASVTVR